MDLGDFLYTNFYNMRTRENILSEVLSINREIEEREETIKKLYEEAKRIEDEDDDKSKFSYISCIKSYLP